MVRSYKWQPHDKGRHAIPQELAVNEAGHTLCGMEVTAGTDKWPDEARYWPTCTECDLAWRASEGILPWPRKGHASETPPSRHGDASSTSRGDNPTDVLALVIDTLTAQGAHPETARR
ncbi:zinc finger protein [Lentzea sp.]|uniref:zinc finger protein n=1 Tax=Lentzea sp. TaxID=56099 RepID=UPI002ED5C43A